MRNRFAPLLVALLVVAGDRWSKIAVERSLPEADSIPLIPGWLRLVHAENPGAAFGMLAEGNSWLRGGILLGVSALVAAFVFSALWSRRSSFTSSLSRLALAFILGGAVGNLWDRALRGTVTDFIEVYRNGWSFPAFNVADSAITVGAVLLGIELLLAGRKRAAGPATELARK